MQEADEAWTRHDANQQLFERGAAKAGFLLDAFFIDLLDPPEFVVDVARYFLGLFSHQRITMVWKGMVHVRLDSEAEDAEALAELGVREQALLPDEPVPVTTLSLFQSGGESDAP